MRQARAHQVHCTHLLCVECSILPCNALADDLRVLVYEDSWFALHVLTPVGGLIDGQFTPRDNAGCTCREPNTDQ